MTGLVANKDVYVYEYEAVGNAIVQKMVDRPIFIYSVKRKNKSKILGDLSSVKVNTN